MSLSEICGFRSSIVEYLFLLGGDALSSDERFLTFCSI